MLAAPVGPVGHTWRRDSEARRVFIGSSGQGRHVARQGASWAGLPGSAGPWWTPLLNRKRWGVAPGGPFWRGYSCSTANIPF